MFKKNHYIPKFYLKQFTDLNGFLYVYDKESRYKSIVPKHPNNICFEFNRYVLFPNQKEEIVTIEKDFLSKYDNGHSITFKSINNSTYTDKLLPMNIIDLEEFVALTFLRGPASDNYFEGILKNKTLKEFDLIVERKDGKRLEDSEIHEEVFNDFNSKKSLRFMHYSKILSTPEYFQTCLEWRISFYDKPNYFLTSDNPLLFPFNKIDSSILREPVIFPVSSNKSAIRIEKKEDSPILHSQHVQNILIIDTAIRYVISNSAEFLERMINEYKVQKDNGMLALYRNLLFQNYR